jgi:bifunctional enzyme CysN/CysC
MALLDERVELLRLATAGSVDDGKSTLIGRLLYDSKQILADQLEHVEQTSRSRGDTHVNLALLTDGLRAEREQGITIDVAYRSFTTPRRRFIIADTPGHVQYTRNMVTGASTADLAVVLVDARKGLLQQSRRHLGISALLGIVHVVVCVNKMDLIDHDQSRFQEIETEARAFAAELGVPDIVVIPISALHGDNVVDGSEAMPWYTGPSLLTHLETVQIAGDANLADGRFPVQWVVRPISDEHHDYRGYAGTIAGGIWRAGDEVVVLPSGQRTRVEAVEQAGAAIDVATPGMSVTIRVQDNIDISRGDMLCHIANAPEPATELEATVCWMSERPLTAGARYAIKHTTRSVRAIVEQLIDLVDVDTLAREESPGRLELNATGRIRLRLSGPLVADAYRTNRATGSFILIDEATNDTVAAGMIS